MLNGFFIRYVGNNNCIPDAKVQLHFCRRSYIGTFTTVLRGLLLGQGHGYFYYIISLFVHQSIWNKSNSSPAIILKQFYLWLKNMSDDRKKEYCVSVRNSNFIYCLKLVSHYYIFTLWHDNLGKKCYSSLQRSICLKVIG